MWFASIFAIRYSGPRPGDGFEYASVARSIVRGEGAVIHNLTPAALGESSVSTLPFSVHPVGWPYMIAAAFALVGVQQWVPIALSALAAWLLVLITYRWGRSAGGEGVGLLAAALVALAPVVMATTTAGLSDGWFAVLIVGGLALLQTGGDSDRRAAVAGGILLGASWWFRDPTLIIAPLVVVWLLLAKRDKLFTGLAAVSMALPMGMLVLRNVTVFGTLLNPHASRILAANPSLVPGLAAPFRYAHPLPTTLSQALSVYSARAVTAGSALLRLQIPALGIVAVVGFLLYLLYSFTQRSRGLAGDRSLWVLTFALWVLLWGLGVVGQSTERYFIPVLPAMAIFAAVLLARTFRLLWSQRSRLTAVLASLLLAATIASVAVPATGKALSSPSPPGVEEYAALGRFVASHVQRDERIWSDHPSAVSWVADRTSIMLPALEADFAPLSERYEADVMVLTSRTPQWDATWVRALWEADAVPEGWQLVDRIESPALSARLYRAER